MCHETTSVGLKKVIGVGVGTVVFDDLANCDAMFFFGQNTGSNSPRFLHPLQDAAKRGVPIITFNPVREKGLETFVNPQNPTEMLTGKETRISSQYHQVKVGGDIAVMLGICKHVFAADDQAKTEGKRVLDVPFIEAHTHGFEEFEAKVRNTSWDDIEAASGLGRAAIEAAAQVYVEADRVIGIYGMGLTQHVNGFENIAMFVNLLLLKGNIGRDGTGISPVRGHSNVQGQRTVGISEKPELVPLDKLRKTVRLRAAARERHEHRGGLRGHPGRQGQGILRARRQFCPRHPRARGHGSGLGQDGPDGPDRHQAQPQPSRQRQVGLPAAMPRPHRTGHAGQRSAGGHDGGYLQLHPGFDRAAQAGKRASEIRTRYRRRPGQGDPAA